MIDISLLSFEWVEYKIDHVQNPWLRWMCSFSMVNGFYPALLKLALSEVNNCMEENCKAEHVELTCTMNIPVITRNQCKRMHKDDDHWHDRLILWEFMEAHEKDVYGGEDSKKTGVNVFSNRMGATMIEISLGRGFRQPVRNLNATVEERHSPLIAGSFRDGVR